jgi:hypothetical protein
MAITHVKVTYSVQPQTASRVQELSTRWGVPKSEVIRRAIDQASRQEMVSPRLTPMQALTRLMATPSTMTAAEAKRFAREVRLSRRASGRKRGEQQDREWKKYEEGRAARQVPPDQRFRPVR